MERWRQSGRFCGGDGGWPAVYADRQTDDCGLSERIVYSAGQYHEP